MKKIKHVFMALAALLCLQLKTHAQNYPAANWVKASSLTGGADEGKGITYDASGNMYITGYFRGEFNPDNTGATTTWMLTSKGGQDIFVAKYSSTGSLTWAFGMGSPSDDIANSIAIDGSGNIYVVGYTVGANSWDANPSSNTNNVTSAGGTDNFIAKYDGTLSPTSTSFYKWAFCTGGSSTTEQLTSIAIDGSGNIYVAGQTSGTTGWDADPSSNTNITTIPQGGYDILVIKYDGTLSPSSTSFFKWAFCTGGSTSELLNGIAVDGSGNIYVAGYALASTSSNIDMDPSAGTNYINGATSTNSNDIIVAKYDGTLTPSSTSFYKWAFSLGGTSTDLIQSIVVDASSNVYIAGYITGTTSTNIDADPSSNTNNVAGATSSSTSDMFVAKFDGTLTPSNTSFYEWAFTQGGSSVDQVNGITVDGSGNVYLAGQTTTTGWDADPSSNTNNVVSPNSSEIFIAKYDGTLTPSSTSFYKWALAEGCPYGDLLNAIIVDGSGKIYAAGYANFSFDADPSSNTHMVDNSNAGAQDVVAMIYDGTVVPTSTSFYKAAVGMGNYANLNITATTIDAAGNVYTVGYYTGSISMGNTTFKANGFSDMLVAKYSSAGTLIWAFSTGSSGGETPYCMSIDGNGNIYIGGLCSGTTPWDVDPSSNTNSITSTNNGDFFIIKYDGTLTPSNTSFYKWAFKAGGLSTDVVNSMALDASGNIYVAGYAYGGTAWDADPSSNVNNIISTNSNDIFVAKYDGTLTPSSTSFYKWAFLIGNSAGSDAANSITIDGSGNVYVAGYITGTNTNNIDADPSTNTNNVTGATSTSSTDIFLAKYDGTLTPSNTSFYKWAFTAGGTGADQLNGIAIDGSSNIYTVGAITGNTSTLLDVDPSTNTNNVTGATSTSSADIFIAQYDGTLTPSNTSFYKWAFTTGGTGADQINGIAVDGSNIYTTGYITGTTSTNIDADPSTNTNNITGATTTSSNDIFVSKYNAAVSPSSISFYKSAFTAGGTASDIPTCIAVKNNAVVIGGTYIGNVDFQPGSGTNVFSSAQTGLGQSLFIGKYTDAITWNGATSNAWATGSNWNSGSAPALTDYAYIPATGVTNNPTVSSNTTIAGLINDAGRTITINSSVALSVTGDVTNNGTISSSGKLALTGSSAQYLSGTGTYSNLELNNSTGATNAGTINITDTYTPTSGTLTTGGFLTLKSTATGTARIAAGSTSGGYISGAVNTERYVPGKRAFRFLSHPFTTAQSMSALTDDIDITGSGGSPFTSTATNNPSAFYFDVTAGDNSTTGNNPGWTAYTASSTWAQYQAMRVLVRGAKGEGLTAGSYTPSNNTLDMSGTVNQGDVTVSLTKGSGTNFVLVGNPFPSQVNMDAVSGTNIGSSFYIWDANQGTRGAYTAYSFGSSSFNLPCGGAFVTTLSANGSMSIEEADKTNGTAGAVFKTTGIANQVELKLEDSTIFWDRLLLNFDDNAMATVDYPDAVKLYNPDMTFYTLSKDDSMLSIDTRPYVASEVIKLGLYAGIKKDFKFTAPNVNMPAGTKLYFTDKLLSKTIEVTPAFEYWFTVDTSNASWGNNRFELNTQGVPTNSIANVNASKLKVKLVPNPATDNVTVYYEGAGKELNIVVTNMMGVKVATATATNINGNVTIPTAQLANGVYNVTIYNGSEVMTQKLIKQ